jgi:hypothetical protein
MTDDKRKKLVSRTITIYPEQLNWLLDNGYNISRYIRKKIKEDMLDDASISQNHLPLSFS